MPKEYIDREALLDTLARNWETITDIDDYYFFVKEAPAADVVEVVRCKDCVYWEKGKDYEPYCNHFGNMMADTTETDFCSYGERREADG